jgi:ribonuclease-3
VFTHASWSQRRIDSYGRLAFLGDSVLGLAMTTHLYPRLDEEEYGPGELTKIRAQAVSRASCAKVARRLDLAQRLRDASPPDQPAFQETESILAEVCEALIGACYLHAGYAPTAAAAVEALQPEIEHALKHPVDFKSALQERLARRAETVTYAVTAEHGPPHDRMFEVVATAGERELGRGTGRSKKHAEQEAARVSLETFG